MRSGDTLKIFIVEDDSFSLQMYAGYIHLLGFAESVLFRDVDSMLEKLDEQPDVIIINKEATGKQGLEVLRKVKKHNLHTYVVFICGFEDSEFAMDSLKYGAFDYIIKGHLEMESFHKVLIKIREINRFLENKTPMNYGVL